MTEALKNLFSGPLFAILLTIAAYEVGVFLKKKTHLSLASPMLIGVVLCISFLNLFKIEYETYKVGGDYLQFLLGPVTAALAIPLYKKLDLLKAHYIPILTGILVGSVVAVVSCYGLSKLFNITPEIYLSLVPKNVTTPVAMALAEQIGGIPTIAVVGVLSGGVIGQILMYSYKKIFRIKNKIAMGIASGTLAHGLGTARCLEEDETEAAFAGLSMGLTAIAISIVAPILVSILPY